MVEDQAHLHIITGIGITIIAINLIVAENESGEDETLSSAPSSLTEEGEEEIDVVGCFNSQYMYYLTSVPALFLHLFFQSEK